MNDDIMNDGGLVFVKTKPNSVTDFNQVSIKLVYKNNICQLYGMIVMLNVE